MVRLIQFPSDQEDLGAGRLDDTRRDAAEGYRGRANRGPVEAQNDRHVDHRDRLGLAQTQLDEDPAFGGSHGARPVIRRTISSGRSVVSRTPV